MLSRTNTSKSRVYLDTWVLVSLVSTNKDQRSYSEWKILKKLTGGSIDVVVPQAVLGETVAVVMRKNRIRDKVDAIDTILNGLLKNLDRVPEMPSGDVEGPGTYGEPGVPKTAKIMVRLCEELDLNFADALILAHALADPYSTHLITGDVRLRSDGVEKFEEDMRNSGERERKLLVDDRFSHG